MAPKHIASWGAGSVNKRPAPKDSALAEAGQAMILGAET